MKIGTILTVVALTLAQAGAAEAPRTLLLLKTGEKFATQESAGPTVAKFTDYLSAKAGGAPIVPVILNEPLKAISACASQKPVLGIVTPGFFLLSARTRGMEPLLEVRRAGVAGERQVLVVRKDASADLATLTGKTIASSLGAEPLYVCNVVLQGKLGAEVPLKPTTDVEGAVFDLVEKAKTAADAVLLDEAAWKIFEKDEELGPKLKVIYRSEELPGALVVLFRANVGGLDVEKVKIVLKEMNNGDAGKQVLSSIRVEAFADIDKARLARAEELFRGK